MKRKNGFSLGGGCLGNGITVWNRNREVNGDYETVAHIDVYRNITYRVKNLPEEVKREVEAYAKGNPSASTSQPERKVFHEEEK